MTKRVYLWAGAVLLAAMGTSSASFAGQNVVSAVVVVQIGNQTQSSVVVQNDIVNSAMVFQSAGSASANSLVLQAGSSNAALVVQKGSSTNSGIGQFGTLNNAVVIQGQ